METVELKQKGNWKKIVWRTGAVVLALYVIIVIARIPHAYDKQRTDAAVAKIHATKLTLNDVTGKNLPPDPAFAKATAGKPGAGPDDTIEGIDANHNGIRDDVELAIFKEYPNSRKTHLILNFLS